jgi:hypothetical protein
MTRLIEILISLAIVAALFLIVGVLLPDNRHLSHSVETNRKLTIVYDTLNSLRRFRTEPAGAQGPEDAAEAVGPGSRRGRTPGLRLAETCLRQGSWEITKPTRASAWNMR